MSSEGVHQRSPQNRQSSSSPSVPRSSTGGQPQRSLTQEEAENEAFEQNKFETIGLQLKEKDGTITSVEQQRLGMLQAKRDSLWKQREESAAKRPNLLEILTNNSQTTENKSGYRSPALQIRAKLRNSSVSGPIIQRAVTTSGGEWDTDQYDLVKDSAGGTPYPPAAGVRGVDMKLKFTPNENVDAELIGLTQSVQAFVNNAPNLTPAAATRAIPSKDAVGINTGAGETDEGTAIDRASSYNNPIYPVKSTPSKSLDDTNTSAGWGQHGFRYKDASGTLKTQNAILIDEPRRGGAAKDSRHIFETTALATKGTQAGTYYGSVRWGWRTDDKANFTKIPLAVVSQGVPSSTFMKAAEIWNAGKSSTGDANVKLPIVDVKVTTAPITGVYPPNFVGPPLQIPAGTRVQIIQNAAPPNTNGKIKVIDGTFTGNTLEVTPADMANLKDERA